MDIYREVGRATAREVHQRKMAVRRAEQWSRTSYWTQRNDEVRSRIEKFCEFWKTVRRKNGIGSRTRREAASTPGGSPASQPISKALGTDTCAATASKEGKA